MKQMNFILITFIIGVLFLTGAVSAAQQVTISNVALNPDGTGTATVVMNSAPTGLAGFKLNLSITDPKVADNITLVTYPSGFGQYDTKGSAWSGAVYTNNVDTLTRGGFSSGYVKAMDLSGSSFPDGSTNILLATVTLHGLSAGSTTLHGNLLSLSDNYGTNYIPTTTVTDGTVTVTGATTAPVAAFTASTTSGTAPLAVQFNDTSSNTPTSWAWDFNNDGTVDATTQNATYTYTTAGTYSVNLTATNSAGSNSALKTSYITASAAPVLPPVVNFDGTNRTGDAPLLVHFTDQSTNTPTAWAWDFQNDGVIDSTVQNASFMYTIPGTYQVNLTASNAGGSAYRLKGNYITVSGENPNLPGTDFTGSVRSGYAPLTVQFNDTSTNSPTSWTWDFQNDGVIDSTVQNASFTYTTTGTFQVNLTATNAAGSKSRLKANYITVTEAPVSIPVAAFSASATSGTVPFAVQFNDTSSNMPTAWLWDFGDGSTSTVQNATHTFTTAGTYTVNLTVTNAGGSNSKTATITVTTAGSPYANSAWPKFQMNNNDTGQSPYAGPQSNAITWSYTTGGYIYGASVIGSDGTIYVGSYDGKLYALNHDGTLKWNYTTGARIYGASAIASDGTIYIGSYDKNLYAINPDGTLKWSYTTGAYIYGSPAIGTDGTIYVGSGDKKLYALNPDGTLKWSYTTGNYIYGAPAIASDGTVYIGSYDKKIYAINPDGTLKWSYTAGNYFYYGAPAIGSDGTIYIGSYDKKLYALNPDGTLKWSYTTGGYIYGAPAIASDGTVYIGSYDGNLSALNTDGTLKWNYITGGSFRGSPAIGSDGTIYIGNYNKNMYAIKPDGTLKWSYTAGSYFYYTAPAIGSDGTVYIGNYDKKLYAFRDPDTPPAVNFTTNVQTGVAPTTITFTDQSTNSPFSWTWDFGDGNISTSQNPVHTYLSAGTYTVTLTATNLRGSGTETKTGDITITSTIVPVANFTASVRAAGLRFVKFTETSTERPTSWAWEFGDGSTSIVQNPTHSYTAAGTYTAKLTATNGAGSNSVEKTVTVTDPIDGPGKAAWPKFQQTNKNVAQSPYIGPQTNTLLWTFPTGAAIKGSPAIGADGTVYIGSQDAKLYALNKDGSQKWVYTAGGTILGTPAIGYDGTIYFGGANILYALNPDGSLKWSYTAYNTISYSPAIGTDGTIYFTGGNTFYAITDNGATPTEKWTVGTGSNQASSPAIGDDGSVYFGGSTYLYKFTSDGSQKWRYQPPSGMGITTPTIGNDGTIYLTSGSYFIALTDNGDSYTVKWSPTLSGTNLPESIGLGSDGTLYVAKAGTLYAFTDNGASYTQKWAFSASTFKTSPAIGADGTIYIGSDDYNVYAIKPDGTQKWVYPTGNAVQSGFAFGPDGTLYVGGTDGKLYAFHDPTAAPVAAFSATPLTGSAPLAVQFNDTSSNSPISWAWDFQNDGIIDSTVQNATFTYTSAGTYTVNLTATNSAGSNSLVKTNYITVSSGAAAPVAAFSANATTGTVPVTILFTDTSTNSPTAWLWDFGDGSTSTVQNATHTFTTAGMYAVNLTATNSAGSSSQKIADYITASAAPVLPPVVNFDGTNRTGDAPLLVHFTDQSTNTPTAWAWDFQNDGVIDSTVQNASFTYTIPGTYQVNLTASNAGGSAFRLKGNYITVSGENPNLPGTDFTGSVRSGYAPLTVQFNDTSSNNPTSWAWDFQNDGVIDSTVQNASFTYTTTGTFQVNLTATNAAGSKSRLKANYITVTAAPVSIPVAAFSASATSGTAPLAVQFNDTSSNTPTAWLWDFGDGSTSTVQNATHTFTTAGTYAVNLTATNAAGSNSQLKSAYITITAPVTAPVASFNGAPRTSGAVPLTVRFSDNTTVGSPTSWYWEFGDGMTSTEQNPTHTYTAVGTYTVNLTATGAGGSTTSTKPGYIALLTPQPIPSYSAINLYVANDKGVYYDEPNGVQSSGTYIYKPNTYYLAMFGGLNSQHITADPSAPVGQVTNSNNPSGTFWITQTGGQPTMYDTMVMIAVNGTIPDDFNVHIRSSGYKWARDSPATSNSVTPSVYTYSVGEVDETFTKSDLIYGPQNWKPGSEANYPIYYRQDMSDTSNKFMIMFVDLGVGALRKDAISPQIDNGGAKVEFTVNNLTSSNFVVFDCNSWYSRSNRGTGIKDTNSVTDSVTPSGYTVKILPAATTPIASFSSDVQAGPAPLTVRFSDTSANSPTSWLWDFGDGSVTNATLQSPVHTFATAGTYTVNLTATNSAGSNSHRVTSYITVNAAAVPPVSAFSANTTAGPAPLTVLFHDDSLNEPAAWLWDFGDGSTSNVQDVLHTYTTAGTYAVNLTVTNAAGGSSHRVPGYITVGPAVTPTVTPTPTPTSPGSAPEVHFLANTLSGTAPLTVIFTDISTNSPTAWSWDFGDNSSTNATAMNPVHTYAADGNYTVNLTVKNAAGSGFLVIKNYIVVGTAPAPTPTITPTPTPTPGVVPPTPAFRSNRTDGDNPLTVKFIDGSTHAPTSWSWDFGDHTTSAEQNPAHTFTGIGNYTVNLTVSNSAGSNTVSKAGYITVLAPYVEQNTFVIHDVQTVTVGTVQNVTITTGTNVTTSGNVVTISNSTSWSSLAITMKDAPVTGGATLNGTVNAVKAVTEPVTAPIESVGSPTVQISLNMSEMPGSTAAITQTITKDPDATAQTSFSLLASSAGKQIDDIAYTINVQKTNLANAGDGGIIQSATLTLTVSKSWVDDHGGVSCLAVLRRAEDGTTQILTPTVTGPDANDDYTVIVISPRGLSTFSLASITAVTSSGTTSSVSYVDGGSDAGSYKSVTSTSKSTSMLAPPDPNANPWTTQTVNGPTHIAKIELQPVGSFSKDLFLLTEKPDSLPADIPSPGAPVYELHKINLYHATSDDVNQAKIEFTVSPSYLESQKMTYRDVQLYRFHDKAWEKLPTEYVGMKDGAHLYRATSTGFSYFATVLVKDATILTATTTAPTPAGIRQQVSATPAAASVQGTAVPTAAQTQAAPPVTDTPKSAGFPIPMIVFGIAAIIVLGAGGFIARKWWIRKQNPSLFRDEPFFGNKRR
ncbi:PKD domain-containing protein [uncultured Methanoregula sp.]|uniref:PKD domain-containing protein n=1 Tax=uncultured Methanoregula sp. TaxID=1005933 RepID=UPI002AAC1BD6|nr:PKD domain-containing protein [uncultured Methanoregula sp.]